MSTLGCSHGRVVVVAYVRACPPARRLAAVSRTHKKARECNERCAALFCHCLRNTTSCIWLCAGCRKLADGKRVHYVDCHLPLLLTSAGNLNATLLPDTTLPSAAGYDRLFSACWNDALDGIIAGDSCQLVSWTGPCTMANGKKGHCNMGACQVRSGQPCPDTAHP